MQIVLNFLYLLMVHTVWDASISRHLFPGIRTVRTKCVLLLVTSTKLNIGKYI